ncbi:MAG: transporter substrate-binding protein [Paenibacillus sp.]|nr:transporter substrate-binding protein [Paenibacillus sp.]
MRKKLIITAMCAMLLTAAGCSSGTTAPSTTGNKGATESSNTETKKATITWWAAWNEGDGPGEMIKKFNQKYPDIKVNYVQFQNTPEGNVKLDTALLASQDVDVFFNYGTKYVDPRAKKNLLLDLSDSITKDKFNVEAELGTGIYQYKDKYYSLPATAQSSGIWMNKKYLDAAGLKTPTEWTLEEFNEYARKMTKGEGANKIYGSSDSQSALDWHRLARGVIGTDYYYNKEGLSNFDHPVYKTLLESKYNAENVEKFQYSYKDYKATKGTVFDVFMLGKAAMVSSQNAIARVISDTQKYPRDFMIEVAPNPTLTKGQKNYNSGVSYFGYLAINAKTKEKEASWTFMKWLLTEGSLDFAKVGHLPTWKKTNKNDVITIMFGADADKKINLEQVKRVLLDYDSISAQENEFTAQAEIITIATTEFEKAIYDQINIDQALGNMKKESDQAITKAKK